MKKLTISGNPVADYSFDGNNWLNLKREFTVFEIPTDDLFLEGILTVKGQAIVTLEK